MLITSGNVLTLLLTGLPSSLSATNTTSSSCLPKKEYHSSLVPQPPTTPNVFGKQSTNSYTANPPHRYPPLLLALHLQTVLLLFHRQNIQTSSFSHQQPCYIISALILSCQSPDFSVSTPASESEVHKILSNCPNKQSDSDPIPTWLLKEFSSVLVSTINNVDDTFYYFGNERQIRDRPIVGEFLFIHSGFLKQWRDNGFLESGMKLAGSEGEAYCKHHSTETALLYIHDHLISAVGSQKVSCLCSLPT